MQHPHQYSAYHCSCHMYDTLQYTAPRAICPPQKITPCPSEYSSFEWGTIIVVHGLHTCDWCQKHRSVFVENTFLIW